MARILVCDDSSFLRTMLKRILIENGYEVVGEACDGEKAVEMFRACKPDLITMDITMPKMSGIDAVRTIHEESPLTRIVMVTAIGQRAIISDALRAGASDFIVKPFENKQVIDVIKKLLS